MTCLVLGDHTLINGFLEKTPPAIGHFPIVGTCHDSLEALAFLQQKPVDLLIVVEEEPNLAFLEHLARRPLVIVISRDENFAAMAWDYMVVDFLVKPVAPTRFMAALQRAKEIFDGRQLGRNMVEGSVVFVRSGNSLLKIRLDELLWVQALGDYVVFHLGDKKHLVHTKLRLVEERLPPEKFVRLHRRFIVALDKIEKVEEGNRVFLGGQSLPVSQGFRSGLLDRLNFL